jgi:DNA-binding transcriptional LysR family regulator
VSAAGQKYLERVSGALAAITAATDDLRQGSATACTCIRAEHCEPVADAAPTRVRAGAPGDFAESVAAHTHSDFALGQVDIDIRYGVPQWHDLVVEPLFEERIVPLASPDFIRENRLKRAEQLLRAPDPEQRQRGPVADWFAAFTDDRAPDRFSVQFDRAQLSIDAATQGWVWRSRVPRSRPDTWQTAGSRRCWAWTWRSRVKAHFAVYPTRHARRPPVEAFLTWLHGEAAKA